MAEVAQIEGNKSWKVLTPLSIVDKGRSTIELFLKVTILHLLQLAPYQKEGSAITMG